MANFFEQLDPRLAEGYSSRPLVDPESELDSVADQESKSSNFFAQFDPRLAEGYSSRPLVDPESELDSVADQESKSSNFFAQFDPRLNDPVPSKPIVPAEPEPEDEPGFFKSSVLDQLIGGGYEYFSRESSKDALDLAEQRHAVESGTEEDAVEFNPRMQTVTRKGKYRTEPEREQFLKESKTEIQKLLDDSARLAAKGQEIPFSKETQDFMDDNSELSVWEAFKKAPAKIIAEIGARSGIAMTPGLLMGTAAGSVAGPVGFMAGMGVGSGKVEYVASLMGALQEAGVDLTDADSLMAAAANDELMQQIQKKATIRAVAVGGVDSLAALVGAKTLTPGITNVLMRELSNVGLQMPTQALMGGGGEALAQFASGEDLNVRQIAAEAAGEFVTAPVDVAAATIAGVRAKAGDKNIEPAIDTDPLDALASEIESLESHLNETEAAERTAQQQEFSQRLLGRADEARQRAKAQGADMLTQELAAANVMLNESRSAADDRKALDTHLLDRRARIESEIETKRRQIEEEKAYQAQQEKQEKDRKQTTLKAVAQREEQIGSELEQQAPYVAEGPAKGPALAEAMKKAKASKQQPLNLDQEPEFVQTESGERLQPLDLNQKPDVTGIEPSDRKPPPPPPAAAAVPVLKEEAKPPVDAVAPVQPITPAAAEAAELTPPGEVTAEGEVVEAQVEVHGLPGTLHERDNVPAHLAYGSFANTKDKDGDEIDFIQQRDGDSGRIFVVDHMAKKEEGGGFEQHKVLVGFPNQVAARRGHREVYPDNRAGAITEMSPAEFREWTKQPQNVPVNSRVAAGPVSETVETKPAAKAESKQRFEKTTTDVSKTFGKGAQQIRYSDSATGSYITVVKRPGQRRAASVLDTNVPEKHRGKGVGKALLAAAMKEHPSLMGQIHSKAAAVNAYKAGRRPMEQPDAALQDVFDIIDRDSSVNMATPEPAVKPAKKIVAKPVENVATRPEQMTPDELAVHEKQQWIDRAERELAKARSGEEKPSVFSNGFKSKAALVRDRVRALKEAQESEVTPDIWNTVIDAARKKAPVAVALVNGLSDTRQGETASLRQQLIENLESKGYVKAGDFYRHSAETETTQEPAAKARYRLPDEPADTFYSALHQTVQKAEGMPKKAPASQFKQWLDGQQRKGNLKQEEREWLGVDEWLAEHKGPVSREELQAFIADNQVTVEETVLGDTSDVEAWWNDEGGANEEIPFNELSASEQRAARERYVDEVGQYEEGGIKFSAHQLPGGENYRELLLRLPRTEITTGDVAKRLFNKEMRNLSEDEKQQVADEMRRAFDSKARDFTSGHFDEPNILVHVRFNERTSIAPGSVQTESDKSTANSLAADSEFLSDVVERPSFASKGLGGLNIKDREAVKASVISAIGDDQIRQSVIQSVPVDVMDNLVRAKITPEKFFNNEAMLSDSLSVNSNASVRLSVGAVRGLVSTVTRLTAERVSVAPDLTRVSGNDSTAPSAGNLHEPKRILFIEEIQSDLHQKGRKEGYENKDAEVAAEKAWQKLDARVQELVKDNPNLTSQDLMEDATWMRLREEHRDANAIAKGIGSVPDAPFKKSWPLLAMKRMIRWAAENGFDSVAWTTGEQQADRYDISKHVSRIDYEVSDNGKEYDLEIFDMGGGNLEAHEDISIEEVEKILGKELAKKISEGAGEKLDGPGGYRNWMTLSGLDLKVGGEGMKGFYDKILPAEVNKYVKKWGGKVVGATLPTESGRDEIKGKWVVVDESGRVMVDYDSEHRAREYVEKYNNPNDPLTVKSADSFAPKIHSLNITPQMRASALEQGQPLFRQSVTTGQPLTRQQATTALEPLTRQLPGLNFKVLGSPREAPGRVRALMKADGRLDAPGIFLPETGEIFLFSENNHSEAELVKTLLHEGIAHLGLRALSGDPQTFNELMDSVYAGIEPEALQEIVDAYGLDIDTVAGQREAADEYIARLAESDPKSSIVQQVVDWVRKMLRKVGLVQAWTDSDIHALLRDSRSNLAREPATTEPVNALTARYRPESAAHKALRKQSLFTDPGVRYALNRAGPQSAVGQAAKLNATMEDAINKPGSIEQLKNKVSGKTGQAKRALLPLISRRNLRDFIDKTVMPALHKYTRQADRMDGRRNELLAESGKIAHQWHAFTSKNKELGRALGELMQQATLRGMDPAEAYRPLKDPAKMTPQEQQVDQLRRQMYQRLRPVWERLGREANGEGQTIYRAVRDAHMQQRQMVWDELKRRIDATAATPNSKKVLIEKLRVAFESGRVAGVYFPLTRFGDNWAVARNTQTGEVVAFSLFESPRERKQWMHSWSQEPDIETKGGVRTKQTTQELIAKVDPNFAAKVTDLVGSASDPTTAALADDIWQMYLNSLPEMSMRKAAKHRKGTLGYSADQLKSFSFAMFHGAHQLARLEYVHQLEDTLTTMRKEATALDASDHPDSEWANPVLDEMVLRHNAAMKPSGAKWATALTTLGFGWYLGVTPAAAFVNLTQTWIVGLPVLAAKFNAMGAAKELSRVSADILAGGSAQFEAKLLGDELKAWREASTIGLFDKSMAHNLAGLNEHGAEYSMRTQRALEAVSFLFHKAEQYNRQVTFMASYRLAKQKGMPHDEAVLAAEDLTWDSHFDYGINNRARVMQGNVARVVLLFRQYSANMTYRLGRDLNDALRKGNIDPQLAKEARTRFAGMMMMTGMFSGLTGLWGYSVIKSALQAVFDDDDDDPIDLEASLRHYIAEMTGSAKAAEAIMKGPFDAFNPLGASISGRVSLSQLWFRDAAETLDGRDKYWHYVSEALGPIAGIGAEMAQGLDDFSNEKTQRGLERFVPKVVKDILKTYRFATEGAQNYRGDMLLPPEDFSFAELLGQTIGFAPAQLSMRYEYNRDVMDAQTKLKDRRSSLLDRLWLAGQRKDQKARKKVMTEIERFNSINPTKTIDFDAIWSSARNRIRYSAMARNGITLDPDLYYLYSKYDYVTQGTKYAGAGKKVEPGETDTLDLDQD